MTAAHDEVAQEALDLIDRGFQGERDPYGIPWFRKRFPDGRAVLDGETHQLRKSFKILYTDAHRALVGSALGRSRFQQGGTGLYGPSRQRIRSKSGKVMRWTSGGGAVFARSTRGQQQRRMVPVYGFPSPIWNRAMRKRLKNFFAGRLKAAVKAA